MTKNDLLWLSHFLRRVVTHNTTEVDVLWRLVSQIEAQLNAAPTQSGTTLRTVAHDERIR